MQALAAGEASAEGLFVHGHGGVQVIREDTDVMQALEHQPRRCATSSAVSTRLSATGTPIERNACTLCSGPPTPPEMMAPAWPIRLPGGAERPEMKATSGLRCASGSEAT